VPSFGEIAAYFVIFVIIAFIAGICLLVWGSLLGGIWNERKKISSFFKTNPMGDWILSIAVAIPAFGLVSMLFDPTFRTVGYFILYVLWLLIASLIYFFLL
jgi:uncharacterized BrkB/YihY/UPF0761 family membrane protein